MKKRMAATTVAAMVLTVPLLMAAADVNKGSLLLVPDNIPIKEEYFPDENFRNCLLERYDTDKDEKLSTQERSIDYLSCYDAEISSLAGIGYFPNLKGLFCDRNKLTSLDLSQNTNLETLYCYNNNLKSLNLRYNTKLKEVWCYGNELEFIDFGENTVLKDLRCSDNALDFLDLSRTTELQILHCSNNNLGYVDVTQNTKLTDLECCNMDLEDLNITALNDLSKLDCSGNKLERLDTTANEALTELNCSDNELTELDLTANNALTELYCSDNELTILDLSENNALTELDCSNNKLTELDLFGKTNLKYLVCHGNSIEEVSILECPELMYFYTVNGPEINDKIKAKINSYSQEGLSFDLATVVINNDDENGVKINKDNFPDERFREALIYIDPDNSGFLSADELITNMDVSNKGIKDLKGIELFTSLKELSCYDNELKSIDLSHNTKLERFNCSRNSDIKVNFGEISSLKYLDCNSCGLKELDVSSLEQLESLGCSGNNELTELDLSKNSKLRELSIYDTGLSSVSIADCPYLIELLENNSLYIGSNSKLAFGTISDIYSRISVNKDAIVITSADDIAIDKTNFPDDMFRSEIQKLDSNNSGALSQNEIAAITELDVSGKEISTLKGIEYMTSLKTLNCGTNDLTSLDVSENTALEELHCSHNSISSLIIGENANLKELYCSDNILNALDISKFPSLEVLDCDKNNIGSLDLSNNPALYILDCSSNAITDISVVDCPYFVQILEEDPFIFSYAHDTKEAYDYVYDLVMGSICVDDDVCVLVHTSDIPCNRTNFPDDNFRSCIIAIADGDNTYSLSEEETADITEIKVPDMSIADLGGIENFKNLETLDCSGNRLGMLDLSKNTSLKTLDCSNNELTQLSIGTAVTDLDYSNNKLASLDLSNLTALTSLNCSGNGISALNIGSNTKLVSLDCSDNALKSLDISKNGALASLKCDGNDIPKISVIDNSILKSLVSTYGFTLSSDSMKTCSKDDNSICADLKTAFIVSADDILIDDETVFPDPIFRDRIAESYDVDLTRTITSKDIEMTKDISTNGCGVKDLKGIELFTEIESLDFSVNPISSVDLSKNTKIKSLFFEKTDVKSIDLGALTSLERLYCDKCQLESLDLSNNTSLKELDCSENPSLGSLDLSNNKGLVGLACINDGLDALDLTNNKLLLEIDCRSNNISSLDVTGLVKLTYLYCGDNQIETLDLSNNELLVELGCEKNNIPEICLGGCPILSSFVEGTRDWTYDAETDTVTYGKIYSDNYLCRDFDTTVDLDKLKPSPFTAFEAKPATCTENGNIAYWYVKSTNKYYSDKDCTQEITLASTVIKATGHDWGDVKYTWNSDHSKCTAERICKNDASHIETETAVATSKVTTPATVTNKGTTTYSVVFKNSAFVAQTESVQDIPVVSATPTPKATATPTATPKVTATPTVAPTAAATATAAPTETPTATPTPVPTTSQEDPKVQILEFVKRIYIYVLDREPEKEGSEYWSNELYNFNRTGAEVAQGFIFSEEFNNRGTTDKQFVEILYKTFFGRDADEAGINFWLEQLSTGTMDRTTVANGFIYSQEWADTCASYGIRSGGDLKPQGKIEPTDLTYAFVERMYTTAMGRGYDEEGRQYWAGELANFNITGEQVGASFFLSAEMEGYNLSDQEFLNRLYATFMNREADADGSAYWLGVMASGTPRADIVYGFTRSPEFTAKCVEARILPF